MTLPDAIIGHTGFVGSNLCGQRRFDTSFNSRNIEEAKNRHFDEVVCAGVSAVKWLANKDPESDWAGIKRLMDCLQLVHARRFTLISTVDVYPSPTRVDETDKPETTKCHPYGRHRLALEDFVASTFPDHCIVRLPALFGPGLKKNALFDLLTSHMLEKIIPNAAFQWYPTTRLAEDLRRIGLSGIKLINITSQPILMEDLSQRFFPDARIGTEAEDPPRYDVRSRYDWLLDGSNGYHLQEHDIWHEMARFVETAK